ncbi:uncharacterized protein K452DRAFT_268925 [Aplosporella prunicola CBS 121167]|uniref:Rhodopsin domain-containing protein n=1 Tax=Aplosporella prunicola CBS 121167 TaxID=1176127 RepID=A0A6A6BJG1_9PEZI|nr:uncharacterized protein K452DRAFT_268925 [Aplosporella prunicola CBS 121167]KAF2143414.1 hypothetical protein K452DRAFT_268925 [Aplosporella prunicola CBS 121167]
MANYHPLSETESKAPIELAVCIAFLAVTWTTVCLRCYARACVIHSFGWDDATMLLAVIFFTVYCTGVIIVAYGYGGGTHTAVAGAAIYDQWIVVSEACYISTTMLLKISIGIFFLRIISKPWQKNLIIATIVLTIIVSGFFFFFVIFMCGNPKYFLIRYVTGRCAPRSVLLALAYTHTIWNMAIDWVYACVPIALLWGTTMDLRKKITVFLILFLAVVGCSFSTVRIKYIAGLVNPSDFLWSAAMIAIWNTIECGAGITAGSLATLRPLLRGWYASASRALSYMSPYSSKRRASNSAQKSHRSGTTQSRSSRRRGGGGGGSGSGAGRPYEKISSDRSQDSTSKGGGRAPPEEHEMRPPRRPASVALPVVATSRSHTSLATGNGTERLVTITESFERESHWLWPRNLLPARRPRSSYDLDVELGAPFEIDRRSSHAMGEVEAEEVRRALGVAGSEAGTGTGASSPSLQSLAVARGEGE